jgi:carbon storage regulator
MLLLDRRPQETITIGEDIVITVVRVDGNNVRIGIDAPKSVPILRHNAKVRVPKVEAALV